MKLDPDNGQLGLELSNGLLLAEAGWDLLPHDGSPPGARSGARLLAQAQEAGRLTTRWRTVGGLEVGWTVVDGARFVSFRLEITNPTERPVPLGELVPLTAWVVGPPAAEWCWLDLGYQSWSPCRLKRLGERSGRGRAAPVAEMSENATRARPRRRGHHSADWAGALATGDRALGIGFVDFAGKMSDVYVWDGARPIVLARSRGEGIALGPGESRASGTLALFAADSPEAALEAWAGEAGERSGARKDGPEPVGWCSWYDYYTKVSEADVDANLAALAPLRERLGLELFQLDDGYQAALGDWLIPNEKFPSGLQAVAERIRAAGFLPGIWLAPFVARPGSRVAREHPDWFLKTRRGRPRRAGINPFWGGGFHALDMTHPGARGYVRRVIEAFVHEWGFAFLKIDFVYAAALDGARHDPSKTTFQTYREALEIVREAAGEETLILGCGAPLGPSIGLVDLMRVGPDVAEFWRRPLIDRLTGVEVSPSAWNSLSNVLPRQLLHRRLWRNDPDCVLVRERDSKLTKPEVQTLAALIGLLGGMRLISDDMSRLEPDRLAILERILPPAPGAAATPRQRLDGPPEVLPGEPRHGRTPVALVNWQGGARPLELRSSDLNVGADVVAVDVLSAHVHRADLTSAPLTTEPVAAHGTALLHVLPRPPHPDLVGDSVHWGLADLARVEWDEPGSTLTVEAALPGARSGSWWVFVGDRELDELIQDGIHARAAPAPRSWLRLDISFTDHGRLCLRFKTTSRGLPRR